MATHDLPATMKALVLKSTSEPPTVETVPTPQPTIGSAVVRILAANVISYTRDVYNGSRKATFPTPIIPGTSAVARIAAVGPDATKLQPGDLVFLDCLVRSRDEPTDIILAALADGNTPGSRKLMHDVYRDWAYAEYCFAPLESLTRLHEQRLTGAPENGGLGLKIEDLAYAAPLGVPYGGLRDIDLRAGQTVIVAPATGAFGGAAVIMALAMGARVIAMGRNTTSLQRLKERVPNPERVHCVPITGNVQEECAALAKYGEIDAYCDIGPREAYASTHIQSAILSLRHGGRVSFMGGYTENISIPHRVVMRKNLRLQGKWMCERSDIADLFKMIETGVLKLGAKGGVEVVGEYPLEQWKEAWDAAAENASVGRYVVIKPWG
ncbi:hypothetical protein LTR56_010354 [Elasticomyces elasticus]|nr:hypothetical protein LTR56_010354 [Elasticomyces elasticus]KAK3656922.1 hypothetical protein LTR22_009584 [Elasticomyces elasticus]KAK4926075.1 hypothetical protein LTR49_006990 [Elasticomyces elasticus]KAK5766154.1 hypothetical protein LTS12_003637 [Elasticomyces elasticus]